MEFTVHDVPFMFLSDNPKQKEAAQNMRDMMRGFDKTDSLLGTVFFSDENIDLVQKAIILDVFRKSNTRIPYQSKEDLLLAMRYVFVNYAQYQDDNIKEQIRKLDRHVTRLVVPDIVANIELSEAYNKVLSGERDILDYPRHLSKRQSLPGTLGVRGLDTTTR